MSRDQIIKDALRLAKTATKGKGRKGFDVGGLASPVSGDITGVPVYEPVYSMDNTFQGSPTDPLMSPMLRQAPYPGGSGPKPLPQVQQPEYPFHPVRPQPIPLPDYVPPGGGGGGGGGMIYVPPTPSPPSIPLHPTPQNPAPPFKLSPTPNISPPSDHSQDDSSGGGGGSGGTGGGGGVSFSGSGSGSVGSAGSGSGSVGNNGNFNASGSGSVGSSGSGSGSVGNNGNFSASGSGSIGSGGFGSAGIRGNGIGRAVGTGGIGIGGSASGAFSGPGTSPLGVNPTPGSVVAGGAPPNPVPTPTPDQIAIGNTPAPSITIDKTTGQPISLGQNISTSASASGDVGSSGDASKHIALSQVTITDPATASAYQNLLAKNQSGQISDALFASESQRLISQQEAINRQNATVETVPNIPGEAPSGQVAPPEQIAIGTEFGAPISIGSTQSRIDYINKQLNLGNITPDQAQQAIDGIFQSDTSISLGGNQPSPFGTLDTSQQPVDTSPFGTLRDGMLFPGSQSYPRSHVAGTANPYTMFEALMPDGTTVGPSAFQPNAIPGNTPSGGTQSAPGTPATSTDQIIAPAGPDNAGGKLTNRVPGSVSVPSTLEQAQQQNPDTFNSPYLSSPDATPVTNNPAAASIKPVTPAQDTPAATSSGTPAAAAARDPAAAVSSPLADSSGAPLSFAPPSPPAPATPANTPPPSTAPNAVVGVGPVGSFTNSDVEALANLMVGEAGIEGAQSMAAVGYTVVNRALGNYNNYGSSVQDQIAYPKQYTGYNTANSNSIMKSTNPATQALANQARNIARQVLSGSIANPIGRATSYNQASQSYNTAHGGYNYVDPGFSTAHTFFNDSPSTDARLSKALGTNASAAYNANSQPAIDANTANTGRGSGDHSTSSVPPAPTPTPSPAPAPAPAPTPTPPPQAPAPTPTPSPAPAPAPTPTPPPQAPAPTAAPAKPLQAPGISPPATLNLPITPISAQAGQPSGLDNAPSTSLTQPAQQQLQTNTIQLPSSTTQLAPTAAGQQTVANQQTALNANNASAATQQAGIAAGNQAYATGGLKGYINYLNNGGYDPGAGHRSFSCGVTKNANGTYSVTPPPPAPYEPVYGGGPVNIGAYSCGVTPSYNFNPSGIGSFSCGFSGSLGYGGGSSYSCGISGGGGNIAGVPSSSGGLSFSGGASGSVGVGGGASGGYSYYEPSYTAPSYGYQFSCGFGCGYVGSSRGGALNSKGPSDPVKTIKTRIANIHHATRLADHYAMGGSDDSAPTVQETSDWIKNVAKEGSNVGPKPKNNDILIAMEIARRARKNAKQR